MWYLIVSIPDLCTLTYFLVTWQNEFIISVLNTKSFVKHREDLLQDLAFKMSDLIVLSETWLDKQRLSNDIVPETHTFFKSDKPMEGADSRAGGVAVLVKIGSCNACEYVSATVEKYIQITSVQPATKDGGNHQNYWNIQLSKQNHKRLRITTVKQNKEP